MNSLENRLSLLRPRRPSGWLKYRIFGVSALQVPRLARLAGWATPVTACAVLTFLILDSASPIPPGVSTGSSTLAMLSNVQYAVIETSQQSAQNNMTSYTFDWTNDGYFNSNVRSFSHSN